MNKYHFSLLSCIIFFLGACSSSKDEDEQIIDGTSVEVSITTDILTKGKVMTLFSEGDEINVFAKAYGKPNATDLTEGIKARYGGSKWEIQPTIRLKEGEVAFLYAFSPYTAGLSDLSAIPIDVSKQQDLLYSGTSVPVSYTTHQAQLTMKHALSLISLNISKLNYSGKGELQSISISGTEVFTSGTMNIESGKVTGTGKEDFTINVGKTITATGWTESLPQIWSIPFTTKVKAVVLKAYIDEKLYEARLPEVDMKSGFQYVFRLVLTDYGLEFIPDQTTTISLNKETDQMEGLTDHGIVILTHNASVFTIPEFNGNNVFGSINWGDESSDSYSKAISHTYNDTGSRQVTIETWNSNGFELKELTGIEIVDISRY